MKRILGIFCALTLAALSLFSTSAYDKAFQKGDADLDGRISIGDATLIQRRLAQIDVPDPLRVDLVGDVTGFGALEILDATLIQRWIAGLNMDPYPIDSLMD